MNFRDLNGGRYSAVKEDCKCISGESNDYPSIGAKNSHSKVQVTQVSGGQAEQNQHCYCSRNS